MIFGSPGAPEVSPGTAMAASAAVPAWFAPVRVEGRRYVDGGMHSPTNLDAFAGLGLGTVVVLSPLSVDGSAARGRGLALAQRRSLRRALRREASGLRDEGAVVTFVEPTAEELAILGPNPMNTKRVPAVARGIRDSMRRRLERGELRDHLAPLGERARSA